MRRDFLPVRVDDDNEFCLTPLGLQYPMMASKHPLTALAESDPDSAASIMRRMIAARVSVEHMATLRSVSSDHTAQICTFIRSNAGKGHVHAVAESRGVVDDNRWFFSEGHRVAFRTEFTGEAW